MAPEEKDELFEEETIETPETVDEFGEKIETPDSEMMADMDAPEMTEDEAEDITDEHVYQGD